MFGKKTVSKSNGEPLKVLKGVVDTSVSVVEVGTRITQMRRSSVNLHQLVATTASASEEMVSTVQETHSLTHTTKNLEDLFTVKHNRFIMQKIME